MRDRLVYPDLMRPEFSARECAKQLILLEDHLSVPGKQCPDCVSKHRLAAEAFAEEALHLGSGAPWAADLPIRIRSAQSAQDYRSVRKDLTARLREVGMAGVELFDGQPGDPVWEEARRASELRSLESYPRGRCQPLDPFGVYAAVVTPCDEERPCPSGWQCYIPKSPGSNGGNLTWPEKLAAEEAAEQPAPPPSPSWWPLLLIGACVLLVRGPLVKKLAG